jgi:hypothetical protein
MGVSHLQKYADMANGAAKSPTMNSPQSRQVKGLRRPASTSGTNHVPEVPEVNSMGRQALDANSGGKQPPKNGGRMGANHGQPKVGTFKDAKHPISGGELY